MRLGKEDEIITFLRPGGAPVLFCSLQHCKRTTAKFCCAAVNVQTAPTKESSVSSILQGIGRVLTSGKRILHRRFQLLRLKQRELILSSWRFYVFSSLRCCALIEILRICKVVSSSSYLVRAAQVFLSWFLMPGCDATALWVALGALCRGRRQLFRSGQWTQLGFWLFLPHEDSRSTTHWQGELERWRKDIVPWCSMDIYNLFSGYRMLNWLLCSPEPSWCAIFHGQLRQLLPAVPVFCELRIEAPGNRSARKRSRITAPWVSLTPHTQWVSVAHEAQPVWLWCKQKPAWHQVKRNALHSWQVAANTCPNPKF